MKKIVLLFITLALKNVFYGQNPSWIKFSGPSNYQNFDVNEVSVGTDTLGNIYTAASMRDTVNNLEKSMLVKYDQNGVQQWINYYGYNSTFANATHVITLLVDKTGNCYVCGYGNHNSSTAEDFMVIKYNNAGVLQWLQYADGGQNTSDYATCAAFDAGGNIVVGGYISNQGGTWDDMGVVKFSTAGVKLWNYTYNNAAINDEDRVRGISSDASGNIFITGSSYGSDKRDMITIKLNSAGVSQWIRTLPHANAGENEFGCSITTDASGNSYVTGVTNDWITIKYDQNGVVVWTNHYTNNMLNSSYKKIMLDKNNNVVLAGDVFSGSGNFSDLAAFKLNNSNGAQMWAITYNTAGSDDFTDAVLDTSGIVYISGFYEGPAGTDMTMISVSPSGLPVWHSTYSNSSRTDGLDKPYQIVLDKNKNLVVAGVAQRRGSGSQDDVDVITFKYTTPITGISNQSINKVSFNVYPNPSKDIFTFSNLQGENILTITDFSGKEILKEDLNRDKTTVDLSNYDCGIYFYRINGSSNSFGKLIRD
jgi:hypothetical protein